MDRFKTGYISVYDTVYHPYTMLSKLTQSDKDFIIANYPTKGSRYCATHLNHPIKRIQRWAAKRGLIVTPERNLERQRENILVAQNIRRERAQDPASYRVNPNQFMDVKTPEAAYLLGLLWADGYVLPPHRIEIQANRDDLNEVLHIFLQTGAWCVMERTPKGRKPQLTIVTSNRLLVDHLVSHGYVAKSTRSACSILSTIPNRLKHYWWRGLIDGDGCFYLNRERYLTQFSIASSHAQDWTYIESLEQQLGIKMVVKRRFQRQNGRLNGNSIARIVNRQDIVKLGEYIYQGYKSDGIGLKRKWDKFDEIKRLAERPKRVSYSKTFQYRGVHLRGKRWLARVMKDGKMHRLGGFDTEEQAALAYNLKAVELWGDKAVLNQIKSSESHDDRPHALASCP